MNFGGDEHAWKRVLGICESAAQVRFVRVNRRASKLLKEKEKYVKKGSLIWADELVRLSFCPKMAMRKTQSIIKTTWTQLQAFILNALKRNWLMQRRGISLLEKAKYNY